MSAVGSVEGICNGRSGVPKVVAGTVRGDADGRVPQMLLDLLRVAPVGKRQGGTRMSQA
jgi:hypothetical protein